VDDTLIANFLVVKKSIMLVKHAYSAQQSFPPSADIVSVIRTSPPSCLVAIVGEDPIEQNEQEGVFLCGRATTPGCQEDGIIILQREQLGVWVR